jgi:hypothetical protein
VFNFNLSDPWHTTIASRNQVNDYLWGLLTETVVPFLDSVVFTAETKELGDLLRKRLVVPIAEYQLPALVPTQLGTQTNKDWDFFIPVLGDEELLLVTDALRLIIGEHNSEIRCLVQPKWATLLSQELTSEIEDWGITMLPAVLSQEDYVNYISRAQIVVLPYKNIQYYKLQSSGRMVDAIALGAQVLVPEFTSLARHVAMRGLGGSFDSNSPSSLAAAMVSALEKAGAGPDLRSRVKSPYQSIVEQALATADFGRYKKESSRASRVSRFSVLKLSFIFLTADFRSMASGLLGLIGISPISQARLAGVVPRKPTE